MPIFFPGFYVFGNEAFSSTREGLKTAFLLRNIYNFSSYLTGNALRLGYNDQPVNAVCKIWGSYSGGYEKFCLSGYTLNAL
jgi:hypothetical protein